MEHIDKRNKLDEKPFNYHFFKNGKLDITWNGKSVMLLKGKQAEDIHKKLVKAEDDKSVQLILDKVTGNFKRGNEKLWKKS